MIKKPLQRVIGAWTSYRSSFRQPLSDTCEAAPFTDYQIEGSFFGNGFNVNPVTGKFCVNIGVGIGLGASRYGAIAFGVGVNL